MPKRTVSDEDLRTHKRDMLEMNDHESAAVVDDALAGDEDSRDACAESIHGSNED